MTSRHARSININEYSSASVASATRIADRSGDDNIADNAGGDRVDQPVNVAVVETEVVNDAAAVVVSHEDQSDVNSTIAIATATNAFYVSSMPLTANTTIGTRSSENSESNTRPSEPIPYVPYAGYAEAVDVTAEAEEESVLTADIVYVGSDQTYGELPIANPVETVINPISVESSGIGVPSPKKQWLCKGKWIMSACGFIGAGVCCVILIMVLSVGNNTTAGKPPPIARDKANFPVGENTNKTDSAGDVNASTPEQPKTRLTADLIKQTLIDFYVTKPEDFEDETNDHHRAVKWLITDDNFVYPTEEELFRKKIIQRFIATLLYFSLKGEVWIYRAGFLDPDLDECSWSVFDSGGSVGLTCNPDGEVNRVRLDRIGVSGKIPYEIGNMTELEMFHVIGGTIGGTIPESMSKLEKLYYFRVGFNKLEGTIPEGFANLKMMFSAGFQGNENLHGFNVLCDLVGTGMLNSLTADCNVNVTNPERCECCTTCCDLDLKVCCLTKSDPEVERCYDPTPWTT